MRWTTTIGVFLNVWFKETNMKLADVTVNFLYDEKGGGLILQILVIDIKFQLQTTRYRLMRKLQFCLSWLVLCGKSCSHLPVAFCQLKFFHIMQM